MGELVRKKVYCLVRAKIQWTEVVYKVISIFKNLNAVKNRTWLHRRPQIAHLWPSPRDFFFFFSTDFLSLGLPTIYKSTIAISSSHCVAISYATNLIPTMHYILFIFFLTPIFFCHTPPHPPQPSFCIFGIKSRPQVCLYLHCTAHWTQPLPNTRFLSSFITVHS